MDLLNAPGFVVDYPASQRTLRIAFVTETYPPEVNGVATTVARLISGLHERHHEVQLIRPRQELADAASAGERFQEILTRGLPIPRYPNLRMGLPAKRALIRLWSLRRPDVVHIATEGPLGWSALQAALQLRLPVSSDFRTNFHAYSRHYGVGWLKKPIMAYLRKFHNRTQCTMVPTEALRLELERSGFKHLRVVARGVDTEQFQPGRRSSALRREWGLQPDDLLLLHVGRLAPEKNLATVLAAYAAIRQRQPGTRLLLVGDGPLRAELQAQHPDVIFAGQRGGTDLAAHYASADLFLFASLSETYGNVTPEAMASGLPVVAYDYAAAAQLMRPEPGSGVLVPGEDQAAFVQAALDLALDPARRQAIGAAAAQCVARLSWASIVERFEDGLLQSMRHNAQPQALLVPALRQPAA